MPEPIPFAYALTAQVRPRTGPAGARSQAAPAAAAPAGVPAPPAAAPEASPSPAPLPAEPGGAKVIPIGTARKGPPAPPRRTAEELEFLPAALEIIETPASPTLRWTALAICALFAGALLWASLAHVDLVAVAEGKVIPLGQVKVVQPLETAMIRTIHVEEGDHVAAGQLLVELDPTEAEADLDQLTYNRLQAALDAEVARVLITRDPAEPFQAPAGAEPALVAYGKDQAAREIEKHLAVLVGIEAELAQKAALIAAAEAQIERVTLVLPLLEEKLATHTGLYERRVGARPPMLEAQQQVVEKRAELKGARESVRQVEAERRVLQARLAEMRAGFLAEATDRRTKALQKVAQLTQEIAKARLKESYRRLTAAVAGTVQGVKVHTPGAVVTTADTLMTIVPDGTGIEVDALVPNKDVGFVAEGQAVEVKLEAFPFTRYGLVEGRLRRLGRDAVQPSPQGAAGQGGAAGAAPGEAAYPARVTLDRDWIDTGSRREAIRPGMRVSAEIKTGERRVIELLLSPVMKTLKEAGRER